jgi:hypothetical protein
MGPSERYGGRPAATMSNVDTKTQTPPTTQWPGRALALLAWLLAAVAVVTGSEPLLFSVAVAAVAAVALCFGRWRRHGRVAASGPVALSAVVVGVLLFITADRIRLAAIRVHASSRHKQIASVFHNYNDAHHGLLPGPAILGAGGQPLLSWRVALLPYIEQEALYKQFHLDEPWDSAHNLPLLRHMPITYAAADDDAEPYTTPYQVFVGPLTPFGSPGQGLPRSFIDGTSNTILLVEARATVPWTKPVDLVYDPARPLPALGRAPFTRRFLFRHRGPIYPLVSLADGTTKSLRPDISEATLRAAITCSGGEDLGPDWD